MSESLNNKQISKLKGLAQRMDTQLKVGKGGLNESLLKSVDELLARHELVKVKLDADEMKERRKELAPTLAEKTSSHLVTLIGNVIVLYRQNPDPKLRKVTI